MDTVKKEPLFPTHKDFCDFIKMFRKDKPDLPKWKSYPLYIVTMLSIGIFIATFKGRVGNSRRNYYPSNRYRKVVREGILWDSVEWHER